MKIKLEKGAIKPKYQTEGSAGMDLHAHLDYQIKIAPGAFSIVSTGVSLEIPHGYEGQIRPRSGLAAKHGVTVLNSPGTIDSDYRGVIKVILINHGDKDFVIQPGDRIAQIVFAAHAIAVLTEDELDGTVRGGGGLGSTGK